MAAALPSFASSPLSLTSVPALPCRPLRSTRPRALRAAPARPHAARMHQSGSAGAPDDDPLALRPLSDCAAHPLRPPASDALESAPTSADLDAGGAGGSGRRVFPGRRGGEGAGGDDDDLPADLAEALALNIVGADAVARYRNFVRVPLLGRLMSIRAFRTRMLADASFFFKLLIQEVVGNGTALASEIAVRGKHLADELEYVASDLIVGTVVEAAFVWLLAPTLALPSQRPRSALARFLNALPANAFVVSTAARAYSAPQRVAAFFYAGAQYAVIGFVAGIVGTAITYGLIEARKRLDKSYAPKRPLPDVLPNSAAWGAFMALSSNTRFQIVEGMERGIANMFNGTSTPVVNAGIVTLRFANNYWGGVQFVQFFRWLGLHAVDEGD